MNYSEAQMEVKMGFARVVTKEQTLFFSEI